jgi:hypothetical protein
VSGRTSPACRDGGRCVLFVLVGRALDRLGEAVGIGEEREVARQEGDRIPHRRAVDHLGLEGGADALKVGVSGCLIST